MPESLMRHGKGAVLERGGGGDAGHTPTPAEIERMQELAAQGIYAPEWYEIGPYAEQEG